MENKIRIYCGLVFILIFGASCLQKQDALILDKADLSPIVQIRCILVPNISPVIHSIRHKRASYEYGDITYTLFWENGSETVVHRNTDEIEMYIPFSNTFIQEGRTYKLIGKMKEDEFEEEIYIPETPVQIEFKQIEPFNTNDKYANFNARINSNNSELWIISPIQLYQSGFNPPPPDSVNYFNPYYQNNQRLAINLIKVSSTNPNNKFISQIVPVFRGKQYISFDLNVGNFFYVFRGEEVGTNPFYGFNRIIDDKKCMPSSYFFLICSKKSGQILTNSPERWTNDRVPPFSNIPPYPLNIDHKIFKGYFMGYQLFSPPLTLFKDKSGRINSINFFDKNSNQVDEALPNYVFPSLYWGTNMLPGGNFKSVSLESFEITNNDIQNLINTGFDEYELSAGEELRVYFTMYQFLSTPIRRPTYTLTIPKDLRKGERIKWIKKQIELNAYED